MIMPEMDSASNAVYARSRGGIVGGAIRIGNIIRSEWLRHARESVRAAFNDEAGLTSRATSLPAAEWHVIPGAPTKAEVRGASSGPDRDQRPWGPA